MTTMKTTASVADDQPTITTEREFAAPPALVFRAHTDPDALKVWYGPNGFTVTVIAMDFRVGGQFRFTMHGPDGTDYPNRMVYREIVPSQRLVYRHGSDIDNDPNAFDVVVTFKDLGSGRTHMTKIATFPSIEARNAVMKFGAVELGKQTVEKLAAYLKV
ncbi:MAG: SRPBCC family protein [Pseudomonadota bacterium]